MMATTSRSLYRSLHRFLIQQGLREGTLCLLPSYFILSSSGLRIFLR